MGKGRREPLRVPAGDLLRRPVDRRTFLEWSARSSLAGMALLGAWGVAGCGGSSGGRSEAPASGGDDPQGTNGGATLPGAVKVGVIVPLGGVGQFLGDVVKRSLQAAQDHIDREGLFGGANVSYEIVDAPAEQLTDATGRAYAQLAADRDVVGILWCTPIGLREARTRIRRDGIPVVAVFADLHSEALLYPDVPERSIFQLILPDVMSHHLLARYAKEDRGYESAALLFDNTLGDGAKRYFEAAIGEAGLTNAGIEEFNLFTGDYGAQLQRLRERHGQCLSLWGAADNVSVIVRSLADLGASYVDTPTAKGPAWKPHVFGWSGGTGDRRWAELAGDAARTGTLTVWHMGGLVGLPSFPIRDWMKRATGVSPRGGEESPANGYWALLEAVRRAGATDRRRVVEALESLRTRFAGLEFGFEPDRHLAMTEDELVLVTLERATGPTETDPPYVLGREWEEVWLPEDPDYVGPTHLVRPTLEANRRAFPDVVDEILEGGWGTLCTVRPPDATGTDIELTPDCKVH